MGERRAEIAAYVRGRRRLAARWRDARRPEPSVAEGIEALRSRFELPDAEDDPVFVLSCGWRSGSTLLQRLVVSSGEVLVWGEPYRQADLVGRLAGAAATVGHPPPRRRDPPARRRCHPRRAVRSLDRQPVPPPDPPARSPPGAPPPALRRTGSRVGYPRWGFKEVRFGVDDALYLRLLFPRARIVFLHRNPYDAWASFRQNHRGNHFRNGQRVWTARRFGQVWSQLVHDAVSRAHLVDALLVSYQDLVSGEALPALSHHLGVEVPAAALDVRVGASRRRGALSDRVPAPGLARSVEPLAGALGYRRHPRPRATAP